jgi:hypothetical protein
MKRVIIFVEIFDVEQVDWKFIHPMRGQSKKAADAELGNFFSLSLSTQQSTGTEYIISEWRRPSKPSPKWMASIPTLDE